MSRNLPESSAAAHGSAANLADDVSVGVVVRWIQHETVRAVRDHDDDYMRAMLRLGDAVESALNSYRLATQPPNDPSSANGADRKGEP